MAKVAQVQVVAAARFMTEVAPPPVVTVKRLRRVPSSLDTIAEDDREQQLASPSDYGFAGAAVWSLPLKRMPTPTPTPAPAKPREQAGGGFVTRDLGKYKFSGAHGCQLQAGSWAGGHGHNLLVLGYWRAVHALELYKIGA